MARTKVDTNQVTDYVTNNSLFRQAIINGNFDIWQRGATIANTAANSYTADRWYVDTATAGTDKTVSRQDGTGVNGSYYCARVAIVQDQDEVVRLSQPLESQDSIKFRGKKLTLSFYARGGAEFVADNATLVSKIVTGTGTDQLVSAFTGSADAVSQNNTLTTSWVKFTCTTTDVIAASVTQVGVSLSFTHAGSGTTTNYFEVTQVQLCAGDVALPFMPKSYEEELRACLRYYEVLGNDGSADLYWYWGKNTSTTVITGIIHFYPKRIVPTLSTLGSFYAASAPASISGASLTFSGITKNSANLIGTFASGLTSGVLNNLYDAGSANSRVTISAEM